MKKVIGCLGTIIIVALVLTLILSLGSCGAGFGFGTGNGKGDSSGGRTMNTDAQMEDDDPKAESTDNAVADSETIIVKVSVVESDYFYQNTKFTLENLIEELKSIEGDFVVEVTDANSSLKAYNKIIKSLEENFIDYTEK